MSKRPLGFHNELDCFELMRSHRVLFWIAPLWIPVYLMAYIYWHLVLESVPELLRLGRLWRRAKE